MPSAVAIIVAAGTGHRFRSSIPKQFLSLGGRPLLAHTLVPFGESRSVTRIVLVLPPGEGFEPARRTMAPYLDEIGCELVPGGETRQASVFEGLRRLGNEGDVLVAVHDGARPFVGCELIDGVVAAAAEHGGAIAALPVVETLKEVSCDGVLEGTVARERFYRAQTPQCFPKEVLVRAFEKAREDGFHGTDEASLVERIGGAVRVVPGSEWNFKVTTKEDWRRAEYYLERGPVDEPRPKRPSVRKLQEDLVTVRVGLGFDAHRLVEGRPLMLGGERIDFPRGLEGHSDGDCLFHAVTDALLGAVGGADIGSLFPPGDRRWKDAASGRFVERARAVVAERGYRVQQVDVVVITQEPKLARYVPSIRRRLAELLSVAPDAVGVKATTTDGMGFTGRGEGIAVQAVATVTPISRPKG